ncbi:unnamed protein product [Owenia fusiformis]|uniref:Uncharacterized protein n=1 Tax=Owenia fusiformis TaxID=6347 RepID=A0A8J1XJB7_OWEFU|nr:unnamed protein product [Owenia fusiformis]
MDCHRIRKMSYFGIWSLIIAGSWATNVTASSPDNESTLENGSHRDSFGFTASSSPDCTTCVKQADTTTNYDQYNNTGNYSNNATNSTIDGGGAASASSSSIDEAIFYFRRYAWITMIFIGLFGNFMSIYIFWNHKNWGSACTLYLFGLGFADTGVIIMYGLFEWGRREMRFLSNDTVYFDVFDLHDYVCKTCRYLWQVCAFTSSWYIVGFSFERMIAVTFPLRAKSILSVKKTKIVMFTILIIGIILFIPVFTTYKLVESPGSRVKACLFTFDLWGIITFLEIIIICYDLPSVVLFLMNIFIVVGLIRTKARRKKMRTTGSVEADKAANKAAINLIAISVLFLIGSIPKGVCWGIYFSYFTAGQSGNANPDAASFWFAMGKFASAFNLINNTLNFIIYSFNLPFYRAKFLQIITFGKVGGKKKKKEDDSSTATSTMSLSKEESNASLADVKMEPKA